MMTETTPSLKRDDEITFKIRGDVESQIRERAVAQAKDTVSRRVDELGARGHGDRVV